MVGFLRQLFAELSRPEQKDLRVQQPQQQGQIRQAQPRPQEALSVQPARGMAGGLQDGRFVGMGSGSRVPDFLQPSRQSVYEDEYLPSEALQRTGYINPQVSLNRRFYQEPSETHDFLRQFLR